MEKKTDNRVECSFDNPPQDEKVCVINIERFDQCVPKNNYSYPKGKPCVFLKLNKVSFDPVSLIYTKCSFI